MSDEKKPSNRLSIYVSDETRAKMKLYPYINWSAVFAQAVEDAAQKADRFCEAPKRKSR